MSNPYSPPSETSADLWLEKSNFVGAVLGGVAYGIHATIFFECFYAIYRSNSTRRDSRVRAFWLLGFISMLFIMGTLNVACNTRMNQLEFIDNRAYPGGPNAWFFANYSDGVNTTGNVSYVIANFLADGLLLWRTYVVWNTIWIIVFPSIVYLASTAMSIMVIFQSSRPNASLWTKTTVQFSLPYFSISISLNIMLTLLLVGRLLYMSYSARRTIGKDHAATYISVATMLVESATPYAVAGLIFIITYARNSNVQNLVLPVLSQIMCISPELIILRVATGRAVSTKMATGTQPMATMQFAPPPPAKDSSFFLKSLVSSEGTAQTGSVTLGSRQNLAGDV